jgi:iron complex outermembrane receptor protein
MPVIVCILGAFLVLGFASSGSAGEQPPPSKEPVLDVGEVVVTATRLADTMEELRRVPGQVHVITAEDIERTRPSTVQEALRQVPGLILYNQNGNRFQPVVDLRGFNAQPNPSISVFVDGVRVNEPESNAINFDLIPIQDVERIEVLPGATAVFGQNALGGVINIITKRGTKTPQTTVEGALGSFNHYRVSANTSGPAKDFDYFVGFALDRESGFRDFSDGRVSKASGRLGYRPSEATDLSVSYSYVNDALEQAGSMRLSDLDQDRRRNISPVDVNKNELNSVALHGRQKLGWGFSLAGNGFYRQTSREQQVTGLNNASRGITDTDTSGGALQLSHEARVWDRLNRLSLGAEYRHSGINSASSGAFSGFPFATKRLIDEDVQGFFAQDSFDLMPNLTLTGAVRYDSTKISFVDELDAANNGSKWYGLTTPRAGLTYTPWSPLTLYANYGQGFRVPTTDELFASGVGFSNPNLKPMKSETYEVGLRTRPVGWLEGTLALFLTDVKDEIVFDPSVPPFGQNRNSPKSRRQGIEVGAKLWPHEQVDVLLNYTYTEARYRSEATLSTGTVEKGDWVPLVPMHRVNGSITYRPLAGLELNLDGRYVSRQVLLNDEANQVAYRIQDAFILNAAVSYTWKQFTWFLQGNNLTDAKYETFGIFAFDPTDSTSKPFVMPAPGINVLGGVTVRFENYY